MFFSNAEAPRGSRYDLLFDAARFADQRGFCGIWIPERHFHPFGGIFSNPALIAAVLSQVTTRIQIRAGSLVSPLHHTIRIV